MKAILRACYLSQCIVFTYASFAVKIKNQLQGLTEHLGKGQCSKCTSPMNQNNWSEPNIQQFLMAEEGVSTTLALCNHTDPVS